MAEKDEDSSQLELPSFRFGRKRKKREPATDEPVAVAPEHSPVETEPAAEVEAPATRLEPVDDPTAEPPAETAPEPVQDAHAAATTEPEPAPEPVPVGGERKAEKKEPREIRLPAISGMAASVVTGLLVGVLTVGATWGSLRLCEVLQGTPSCGDPGFVLLVAILIAMVLVGAVLLRAWGVPDPGSTSFLAVGLLAVIALLFLVDVLFEWWMIIVIPIVAVLTYTLSHWVTTSLIEPAKD
jgi:hypothetical protein